MIIIVRCDKESGDRSGDNKRTCLYKKILEIRRNKKKKKSSRKIARFAIAGERKEGEIFRRSYRLISLLLAQLLSSRVGHRRNVGKSRPLRNLANTINRSISTPAAHLHASLSLSQSPKYRPSRQHRSLDIDRYASSSKLGFMRAITYTCK